jgi:hypothetical protein
MSPNINEIFDIDENVLVNNKISGESPLKINGILDKVATGSV